MDDNDNIYFFLDEEETNTKDKDIDFTELFHTIQLAL
jgi:hypothetical protein